MNIWDCKIGEREEIPDGGDSPMRKAVAQAYRKLTGWEPNFIFSGWGGKLTVDERAALTDPDNPISGAVYTPADEPPTYGESSIPISLECQGGWYWTAAVVGGEFEQFSLVTREQKHSPAEALRALADQFEKQAQHEFFYKRTGVLG